MSPKKEITSFELNTQEKIFKTKSKIFISMKAFACQIQLNDPKMKEACSSFPPLLNSVPVPRRPDQLLIPQLEKAFKSPRVWNQTPRLTTVAAFYWLPPLFHVPRPDRRNTRPTATSVPYRVTGPTSGPFRQR